MIPNKTRSGILTLTGFLAISRDKMMNSRNRVFKAAELLLRDNKGQPNKEALTTFNERYILARGEGLSVQEAAEIATINALGAKVGKGG